MATDMIETALASVLEELEDIKKREEEQTKLLKEGMEKMEGMGKRFAEQKPGPSQPPNIAHWRRQLQRA